MKQHIIPHRDDDSSFKIVALHLTDLLKWVPFSSQTIMCNFK